MDFEAILNAAHEAAKAAQVGMVEGRGLDCGFAWVTISGNDALARHCRKQIKAAGGERNLTFEQSRLYGRAGEPGWQWWKPGGFPGQSVGIHEAGARAFRDKLAEYGIRADVGSRLD